MTNISSSIGSFPNNKINPKDIQKTLDKSKQVVSDSFENNSMGKIIYDDKKESKRTSVLMVPPLMLIDGIIDKSIGGETNASLLKKIANTGDKISHRLNLDELISKKSASRVSTFLKNNRFFKYFTNDYKAVAKSKLAHTSKMSQAYADELISGITQIAKSPEFESISGSLSKKASKAIKLISSGKHASKLSPSILIGTADELINNGIDTLKEGGMLTKHSSLSTAKNKLITSLSKMGETGLGSTAAKTALKTKNVLTYGGGLLSMYFTASALINAYKAAKEAPKGEKKSTFMHVLSEQYVGLILFQPSMNLMYKLGGNKYRGMTVDARETLKNLIKTTNNNETLTKEGLKIAKLQHDLLIKGVEKSKVMSLSKKSYAEAKALAKTLKGQGAKLKLWEKPLKFAGKILSIGLDKMQKLHSVKLPFKLPLIGNKIKLPQISLSGFAGGAMRFAIIMFILQPLLQKPLTKLTHKIFGEPKTYLNKQKEKEENKQPEIIAENPTSNKQETNLLKIWTAK